MADNEAEIIAEMENQWGPEMKNAGTMAAKDGDAVLRVENAFINRSTSSGRKQLNFQLFILEHSEDPTSVGSKLTQRWGVEKVEDLKRVNQMLVNLGFEIVKEPKDLLRVTREVQGVVFAAKLKVKDPQYGPNVYINAGARRRDKEGGGDGAAATPPPDAGARF